MTRLIPLLVLILLPVFASPLLADAPAPAMLKLEVEGITTVSYPPGLEEQAKAVAEAARQVVPPHKERVRKVQALMTDPKTAKRICELLGCPEHLAYVRESLAQGDTIAAASLAMLSDIRLYRESDIKAVGRIDAGPIKITYDETSNRFAVSMSFDIDNKEEAAKAFTPLGVDEGGWLYGMNRSGGEPAVLEAKFGFCDSCGAAIIHEATELVLAAKLLFYQPYARWFNEGVATWVNMKILDEVAPDLAQEWRTTFMPAPEQAAKRNAVNLLAWPQISFASSEEANDSLYRFSAEVASRMLDGRPAGTLAAIVGKLKGKRDPDTDTICAVVKSVTGADLKAVLMEYVPDDVLAGIKDGAAVKLIGQANVDLSKAGGKPDYLAAAWALVAALAMEPSNAQTHLDLAWILREIGAPKEDSERRIKTACWLLDRGSAELPLPKGANAERAYVYGRTLQLGGKQPKQAKAALEQALRLRPDHADAKAALKELESKEEQAKKPRSGK